MESNTTELKIFGNNAEPLYLLNRTEDRYIVCPSYTGDEAFPISKELYDLLRKELEETE
jgi:hypothetical protein